MELFNIAQALATYFQVQNVVFVSDPKLISDKLTEVALSLHNENKLGFFGVMPIDEICKIDNNRRSIVLNMDKDLCKVEQLTPRCFMSNLIWVTPFLDGTVLPINLRMDSNFLTYIQNADSITIDEHYGLKGRSFQNHFATLEQSGKLLVPTRNKWKRRKNFGGQNIKALTIRVVPVSFQNKDGTFDGLFPELSREIFESVNISLSWTLMMQAGSDAGNGLWTGSVGELQRGNADIIAAPLAVSSERQKVVSFCPTVLASYNTLIIANTAFSGIGKANINMDAFLNVFVPRAWTALLICFILMCLCTFMALCHKKHKSSHAPAILGVLSNINKAFEHSFRLWLQLESSHWWSNLSGRILLLTISSASFIFSGYYEGILVSFFSTDLPQEPITSFGDAVDKEYTVVTINGGASAMSFINATPGTGRHRVYHEIMKDKPWLFYTDTEALMHDVMTRPKYAAALPSLLGDIDERFLALKLSDADVVHQTFAIQLDSEVKEFLDYHVIKGHQSGMIRFIANKWIKQRRPFDEFACNHYQDGAKPLGFENLAFLLIIIVCGFVAAPLVIAAEIIIKTMLNRT